MSHEFTAASRAASADELRATLSRLPVLRACAQRAAPPESLEMHRVSALRLPLAESEQLVVMPATWGAAQCGPFELAAYGDRPFELVEI